MNETIRRISRPVTIALATLLTAAASAAEVTFHNPSEAAALDLPFSEAVRVDDLLFLSGQIGNLPGTLTLADGGVVGQTRQTLANIRAVLARHDLAMRDVVKCTLFLRDMADWPTVNEVYREFFSPPFPARSALGASGLAVGAAVEIECIAAFGPAATAASRK